MTLLQRLLDRIRVSSASKPTTEFTACPCSWCLPQGDAAGSLPYSRRFDAIPGRKFDLGEVEITSGAVDVVSPEEATHAVRRHARGEWGSAEDRTANERALAHGREVLSLHRTAGGRKFCVRTEPGRSATTVLLPEEE
jgi:hypothetical protein